MSEQTIYTIPVNAIKYILRNEEENQAQALINHVWLDRMYFYKSLAMSALNNCKTYNDLENFVMASRKISLQDWINSL